MAKIPRFIPNPAWVPGPPPAPGVLSSRWRKRFRKYLHWILKNGLSAMAIPVAHGASDGPAVFGAGSVLTYIGATGMPLAPTILSPVLNASEITILTDVIVRLETEGWRVTPTGVSGAKRLAIP
jgi:hypothetical protein